MLSGYHTNHHKKQAQGASTTFNTLDSQSHTILSILNAKASGSSSHKSLTSPFFRNSTHNFNLAKSRREPMPFSYVISIHSFIHSFKVSPSWTTNHGALVQSLLSTMVLLFNPCFQSWLSIICKFDSH
jgi:hypothetical protein